MAQAAISLLRAVSDGIGLDELMGSGVTADAAKSDEKRNERFNLHTKGEADQMHAERRRDE